jgi:hypothetical protein
MATHSITSSARASNGSCTVMPSARGGLEVQEHLNFRGLLYRQLARLVAFENAGDVAAGQTVCVGNGAAITHQTAPWQFFADFFQHPETWLASPWFNPSITILGLVLIGASLWFNLWSKKQHVIDDLAEDMAWAVHNLLNRSPTPSTPQTIAAWEADFRNWCDRISRKLENRAFFTRADQLHFDVLGIFQPIAVAGHAVGLAHLESQLNEKLRGGCVT